MATTGRQMTLALFHKFKAHDQQGKEEELFLWLVCRNFKLLCNCGALRLTVPHYNCRQGSFAPVMPWVLPIYRQLSAGLYKCAPKGVIHSRRYTQGIQINPSLPYTDWNNTSVIHCNERLNYQWTTFHFLKKQGCGSLCITKSFQQAQAEGSSRFPLSLWRNQWSFLDSCPLSLLLLGSVPKVHIAFNLENAD